MKTGRIDLSVQFVRQAAADQGNGGPLWGEYGWSGITLMTMPCACWTAREQWARANRLVPLPMARHAIALLLSGAERDVDDSRRARIRNFGDAYTVGLARSDENTSELQYLKRIEYDVFGLKKKT